jgi:multiple sugar transport system permease protein
MGSRLGWVEKHLPYLLLIPAFALIVAIHILPSLYSVYLSLTRYNVDIPGQTTPRFDGLFNYIRLFTKDLYIGQTVTVTIEWVVGIVSLSYLSALVVALLLAQRNLRGKAFYRVFFMLSFAVPITAIYPVWLRIFSGTDGLIDGYLQFFGLMNPAHPIVWFESYPLETLIFIGVWGGFAFGTITILAALTSLPKEQYEAASLDGASRLSVFRRIEWPHIMPLNVILWMLGIVSALNSFNLIYVLTDGGPGFSTTTLYIYAYNYIATGNYAYVATIETTLFIAEIVIAVFYVRYAWLSRR